MSKLHILPKDCNIVLKNKVTLVFKSANDLMIQHSLISGAFTLDEAPVSTCIGFILKIEAHVLELFCNVEYYFSISIYKCSSCPCPWPLEDLAVGRFFCQMMFSLCWCRAAIPGSAATASGAGWSTEGSRSPAKGGGGGGGPPATCAGGGSGPQGTGAGGGGGPPATCGGGGSGLQGTGAGGGGRPPGGGVGGIPSPATGDGGGTSLCSS
uniref:Uncharacterized protein n=1 Tax=Amphimedon queenslandica TaxID=400682 RepID=A0A1X7VHH0_AMPQE